MDKRSEQELNRIEKVNKIREQGNNPYPNGFTPKNNSAEIFADYTQYEKEYLAENTMIVSIAGRIMTKRGQGKAGFANINDGEGIIQVYANKTKLGDDLFDLYLDLDLGDIVFIEGEVFKTKVGELSIRITNLILLTKSLRPLPEKYHGLTDVEERYRRRYLDLMVNEDSKEVFIKRTKIISKMRNLLIEEGYLEVDTPILQTTAGGAVAKPFVTHHNSLDIEMFMRIAPELYLKQLVIGGFNKVFEIGRQFRNEGLSIKHNPEFTTLELYEAYGDINSMMSITERIITECALAVNDSLEINYEDEVFNLNKFEKIHMVDLIKRHSGVDFYEITDINKAKEVAKKHNVRVEDHHESVGHIINEFFEQLCEDKLRQPTFVYGHPIEISPLSRVNDQDPRFTDRFELFIGGREYANAFSELNDSEEQLRRFRAQDAERELGNDEAHEIDFEFIRALEYGLPPTGGLGVGVDRLVMLLTNSVSIRDVLLFPTMKIKDNN